MHVLLSTLILGSLLSKQICSWKKARAVRYLIMVALSKLSEKDILDYLAWKAAKLLGWDTKTSHWRIGFRRQGEYASLIVYSMSPATRRKMNFESLKSGIIEILCPATIDAGKFLACILMASQVNPIYVGKEELLPMKPCLEKILLEIDVEGWNPWRDRSNDLA